MNCSRLIEDVLATSILAVKSSLRTIFLISLLTFFGAGTLTVVMSLDTPWAPWITESEAFFPPVAFTFASLFAAFFAVSGGTALLNILSYISSNPSQLWRLLSVGFLVLYGGYIFSVLFKKYETRELVSANWGTITLQALFCIGVCITLLF